MIEGGEMADVFRRRSVQLFLSLVFFAASFIKCSPAWSQTPNLQSQLTQGEQKLAEARAARNQKDEGLDLYALGSLYAKTGDYQKALQYFQQALPIARKFGDRRGEGLTLYNIGSLRDALGQKQEALEPYNQALVIARQLGDRVAEGVTLNNLGLLNEALGNKQDALQDYNQALVIARAVPDRRAEGGTLSNIALVYDALGEPQKALDYYNQALPILHEAGDHGSEAATLNNIGLVYYHNIENLPASAQDQKALKYYTQALPIERAAGDRGNEAATLNNIGRVYFALGQTQEALKYYYQALPIERAVGNPRIEAATMGSLGSAYYVLGQKERALSFGMASLSLAKAAGDPDLQGRIDAALMDYFLDQKQPEEAVFFGTNAVNFYQQIRKNISGLDKEDQSSFTKSRSATYRELAELLVQTGRLGEAEQVLDLLKQEELKEVVRGATGDPAAKVEPLKLTTTQQTAQTELATPEKTGETLIALSLEYGTLLAKENRTPAEDARLKTLEASIEQGNADVSAFFKNTLYPQLAAKVSAQNANALFTEEKSDVSRLQNTLASLGPRVIGIRLLLGEEHAYAIVVTAHTREKVDLKATPAELRSKVLQVRDNLRSPSSNPKPHLAELYAMVVAPLDDELKAIEKTPAPNGSQNHVPTLLWSLDGVLRYLPMAALYDGQHYMVERFNNVLFTPESYGHMTTPADAKVGGLRVLAVGLSRSYGGLPALSGVMPELEAVVHDPSVPESHGPMEGKLLPNDQFTLAALETQLGAGKSFPVVHIASHFVEQADGDAEPYLMMGGKDVGEANGYELTLSKMEDSSLSFTGTRLLTLSACSTAKGDVAQDGQEMDSLGMIAQQKDAEAVLATLWDVNDASTSRLMSDFYTRWVKHPEDGKAEALRQAQLVFLHGTTMPSTQDGNNRGFDGVQQTAPASHEAGFSHPYYWAPFVLFGNFQ
jgi:CHAT domain-containing protein/Tfp pilus assembly protein PilF